MIIVKNRELLIPNNERYIGTTYDNDTENRVFQVPRFSQRGVDLAALTFRLDIQYANESYDTVILDKEVGEAFIILIWKITSATLQVPGTLYIGIRAVDSEATVKWSSFSAAMYAERHLNTPGNYTGDLTEIEQMEQDHQYMKGVVDELKANIDYAHDAEAWAKGTRSGSAVPSTDDTYHNNSKYYSEQASAKATQAANSATAAANSATQAAETVADTNARFNNAVSAVTSETEVIDARVGADGTTYPVLKTRLDTEHNQLKNALDYESTRLASFDNGYYVFPVVWERGGINTTDGSNVTHAKRIRTNKIVFGNYDGVTLLTIPTGYQAYVFAYNANDVLVGKTGWNSSGTWGISKTQYSGTEYVRYMLQAADSSVTPIDVGYQIRFVTNANYLKLIQNIANGKCYVSTTGSDSNDGTAAHPYKTIQHAVDSGAKDVIVFPGEYHDTLTASGVSGVRIMSYVGTEYTNYTKQPRPVFTNGTKFDAFTTDGSGYKKFALTSAPSAYTAVFINHTQDPIITGNYPSYRAGLWANFANKYDDFRVKPVLTYAELSENNTFYYDGTDVYFHIETDGLQSVTVVGDVSYVFNLSYCDGFVMDGIDIMYADSTNLQLFRSNHCEINDCNFGYTMRSNCVSLNYSNVILNNCEAFKATIDGFNCHYYGVTTYNNCRGMYNYDDGESSHEYCHVIVHGGEYAHNSKGGHAPVNGCSFKCDSTYTHDNGYGFYMVGGANFTQEDILISNSVAKNNTTYDLQNTIYNTKLWNNVIGTQHVSSGTVVDLAG